MTDQLESFYNGFNVTLITNNFIIAMSENAISALRDALDGENVAMNLMKIDLKIEVALGRNQQC